MFGSCAIVFALIAAAPLQGCGWMSSSRDDADEPTTLQEEGRAVFSDPGGDAQVGAEPWTILVATVPEGREDLATPLKEQIQIQTGLSDLKTQLRSGRVIIALGSYDGPDDPGAQRDLERIKSLEINGLRPYAGAYLVPPDAQVLSGSNPTHDLKTVKERFGVRAVYTLQVGVYGDPSDPSPTNAERRENRAAAEQAVRDLRSQGERAFYYHGPTMSMVTVGVFSEDDFDPSTLPPTESMRLKDVRDRFPHNLLNGQGIKQTQITDTGQRVTRLQPSTLVGIPGP